MKKVLYDGIFVILGFLFFIGSLEAKIVRTDKEDKESKKRKSDLEIVFILDRSGSMSGLEKDTIGGYNSMLEKQKKTKKGEAFVTTVLFDHEYELLHERTNLNKMKPITEKEYYVRGSTALLDAIGKTISQVKADQNRLRKSERAKKVLFVIITDGQENASKEFTSEKVKRLIEEQKKTEKWEFLFLGANIDAISTARQFGIDSSRAVRYNSDSIGTQKNFEVLHEAIKEIRSGKSLQKNWKKEIEEDFENRGK